MLYKITWKPSSSARIYKSNITLILYEICYLLTGPSKYVKSYCLLKFTLSFLVECKIHCRNGGTCVGPYKCSCPPGYGGTQCEKGEDTFFWPDTFVTSYLLVRLGHVLSTGLRIKNRS